MVCIYLCVKCDTNDYVEGAFMFVNFLSSDNVSPVSHFAILQVKLWSTILAQFQQNIV